MALAECSVYPLSNADRRIYIGQAMPSGKTIQKIDPRCGEPRYASATSGIRLLPLLLCFVLCIPFRSAIGASDRLEIGVVIGSSGPADRHALRYAELDAVRFAALFRRLHPDGELHLLLNPRREKARKGLKELDLPALPPTEAQLRSTLENIRGRIEHAHQTSGRKSLIYFYFSGYGNEELQIALNDVPLTNHEWWKALEESDADSIIALLDLCESPADRKGTDWTEAKKARSLRHPANAGYLSALKTAGELERFQGGQLSVIAGNGLLGMADLDRNGSITFYEWERFIRDELSRRPSGPRLELARPPGDPMAVLVAPERRSHATLKLAKSFPTGVVQVARAGTREVVFQLFHRKGKKNKIRLPQGKYDVYRLFEADERFEGIRGDVLRARRSFPVELSPIDLSERRRITLNKKSERRAIILVTERGRKMMPPPAGAELTSITIEDERQLSYLPFSWRLDEKAARPPPSFAFSLQLDSPRTGLKLGNPDSSNAAFTPGGALRFERTFPLALRSRWYIGGGAVFQYGISFQHDVYGCQSSEDLECNYPDAYRHQALIGLHLAEAWIGPHLRLVLDQVGGWAPSTLTTNRGPVLDYQQDLDAHFSELRYTMLGCAMVEVGGAVLLPMGRRLELGPVIRVQLELFNQLNPSPIGVLISGGLEFRQRLIR